MLNLVESLQEFPDAAMTAIEILEPVPCHLKEGVEAIGRLIEVLETESFAVAIFVWGSVSLPLELVNELRKHQGKKVAILHLEGYHLRVMPDVEAHARYARYQHGQLESYITKRKIGMIAR